MKRFFWISILLVSVCFAASVLNYREQGGARWVIGGSLDVVSGGDLDIESGGALKIAGTQVTASANDLNLIDGITAGIVTASKAVVADSDKDVTGFRNVGLISAVFEGDTDDANETTVMADDPTADRTITLPDYSGAVPIIIAQGSTQSDANGTTDDVTGSSLTIADGWFTAGKTLKFTLAGTVTGDNDRILIHLFIDDANVCTVSTTDAAGAQGDWLAEFILHENTDAAHQDLIGRLSAVGDTDAEATAISYATDTTDFDDGAATTVKCRIESESGDDTITCEYVLIEHWNK